MESTATKSVTTNEMVKFILSFINGSGTFAVNDGYVTYAVDGDKVSNGEIVEVSADPTSDDTALKDDVRPLVMYADKITNASCFILNPFVETSGLTADRRWFYSTINLVLSSAVIRMMRVVMELGTTQSRDITKKPKGRPRKDGSTPEVTPKVEESLATIELMAPLMGLGIDKKLIEEFETVIKTVPYYLFFNLFYNKSTMCTKVHCFLNDEDVEEVLPKIRKNSWGTWKNIIQIIFGDLEKNYSIIAEVIGCPQLDSTAKCLYEIIKKAGGYLQLAGYHIDEAEFKEGIEKLPLFYHKAQWLRQVVPTSIAAMPNGTKTTTYETNTHKVVVQRPPATVTQITPEQPVPGVRVARTPNVQPVQPQAPQRAVPPSIAPTYVPSTPVAPTYHGTQGNAPLGYGTRPMNYTAPSYGGTRPFMSGIKIR